MVVISWNVLIRALKRNWKIFSHITQPKLINEINLYNTFQVLITDSWCGTAPWIRPSYRITLLCSLQEKVSDLTNILKLSSNLCPVSNLNWNEPSRRFPRIHPRTHLILPHKKESEKTFMFSFFFHLMSREMWFLKIIFLIV